MSNKGKTKPNTNRQPRKQFAEAAKKNSEKKKKNPAPRGEVSVKEKVKSAASRGELTQERLKRNIDLFHRWLVTYSHDLKIILQKAPKINESKLIIARRGLRKTHFNALQGAKKLGISRQSMWHWKGMLPTEIPLDLANSIDNLITANIGLKQIKILLYIAAVKEDNSKTAASFRLGIARNTINEQLKKTFGTVDVNEFLWPSP